MLTKHLRLLQLMRCKVLHVHFLDDFHPHSFYLPSLLLPKLCSCNLCSKQPTPAPHSHRCCYCCCCCCCHMLPFPGYGGCMLPSTFMTMRYGARRWYSAITVAWGIVSGQRAGRHAAVVVAAVCSSSISKRSIITCGVHLHRQACSSWLAAASLAALAQRAAAAVDGTVASSAVVAAPSPWPGAL
jgi:hypothetical protein